MKVATIQMNANFADVQSNLEKAEMFVKQAAKNNVGLVLLPEFFTSAIGFSNEMLKVAAHNNSVPVLLKWWAKKYQIIIGGSYIFFDGNHAFNQFSLVFPSGQSYEHRKDIPTQFENCYYTNGDENNILHTPIGDIGVALCWEMLRVSTLERLSGKVDIVLAGSCWWDLPIDSPPENEPLRKYNRNLALETPITFAKKLGVALIHASHCGTVTSFNFPNTNRLQTRQFVGAAQIINSNGHVVKQRNFDEGEGLIFSDITFHRSARKNFPKKYWIVELPTPYLKAWETLNSKGKAYYKSTVITYYKNKLNIKELIL